MQRNDSNLFENRVKHMASDLAKILNVDSSMATIFDQSSSIALYRFDSNMCEYVERAIDGSMMIAVRSLHPVFNMVFMNKKRTAHTIEHITGEMKLKVEPPFLMYKNGSADIFCIWFADEQECVRMGHHLQYLIACLANNSLPTIEAKFSLGLQMRQVFENGFRSGCVPFSSFSSNGGYRKGQPPNDHRVRALAAKHRQIGGRKVHRNDQCYEYYNHY